MLRFEAGATRPTPEEFEKGDCVLVDIPDQQSFLDDPDNHRIDRKSQKGPTCWYYVLSYLRAHYGKKFPEDHPGRQIEIIFSNYRKQIKAIDDLNDLYKALINVIDVTPITKAEVEKQFPWIRQKKKADHEFDKLLTSFLEQTSYNTLEEHVKNYILQLQIKNCEDTFKKLNINPDKAMAENNFSINNCPDKKRKGNYATILELKACKLNHLIESKWHPMDGVQALIDNLRLNGACYVGGKFGRSFYKEGSSHIVTEKFGRRPIYAWGKDDYQQDGGGLHAILIIGAKRIGQKGYVYFLDPNDNADRVHKISYERLLKSISSFKNEAKSAHANNIASTLTLKGPFAMQADCARNEYLEEFYKAYKAFLSIDTLDKEEVRDQPNSNLEITPDVGAPNRITPYISLTMLNSNNSAPERPAIRMANSVANLSPADVSLMGRYKPLKDLSPKDLPLKEVLKLDNLTPADLPSLGKKAA